MKFICSRCGKEESAATRKPHCSCGGLWDLAWQPPRFSLSRVDRSRWSLFRYREFIALEDESWQAVTLGEGMTPVVPLDGDTLLKMEMAKTAPPIIKRIKIDLGKISAATSERF